MLTKAGVERAGWLPRGADHRQVPDPRPGQSSQGGGHTAACGYLQQNARPEWQHRGDQRPTQTGPGLVIVEEN